MNIVLAAVLSGCGDGLAATEYPQVPSYAILQTEQTALGAALKKELAIHPKQSGFYLLASGSESFSMRLALIEAAQKTLDFQYYSVHDDTTANLLIEAMVRAAKRGVRIRFLLDNVAFGDVDDTFSVLDGYKNLEVRIFNPFATREDGLASRTVRVLTDLGDMNRRMHNKSLIADNQMAIIGGRNLGDEYFEENTDVTFRDLDILTAGPITAAISKSFDNYWNSKNAVPIGQLREPSKDTAERRKIAKELEDQWNEVLATEKGKKLLRSPLGNKLKKDDVPLIWAPAELVVDAPYKIDQDREDAQSKPLMRLDTMLDRAKHDFIAVSPYLVPGDDGVEWLSSLTKRGVKVKIATNSLASTDVVAVHTGYKRYRKALVENGIELYEMKPTGGKRPRQRLIGSRAPASASLHAKVFVVDNQEVMIGSFNLDPRSIELNTELVLVIHSAALATQVNKMFNDVINSESSYHILVDEDGDLVWQATKNGAKDIRTHDPDAGVWRNVEAGFMSLLPIEEHL